MSAAGDQLTATHHDGQRRIAARTVAEMRQVWPLLDPTDLDATFERWALAAVAVTQARRLDSARLAASYVARLRLIEVGEALTPPLAATLDLRAATTSMLTTGPVAIKQAMTRGDTLTRAVSVAEAGTAAAATRHALDGGRETVAAVADDPLRTGWRRRLSSTACDWCRAKADEADRDPTAAFASHDACGCSPAPVYG